MSHLTIATVASLLSRGVKQTAIGLLIASGIAILVLMLMVTASMATQTAVAVFPALNDRPSKPGIVEDSLVYGSGQVIFPPTGASAAVKSDDGINSSLANAMTAVGTAIAAVTLLLSVGTTWFAIKLKEVETAASELKTISKNYQMELNNLKDDVQFRNRLHHELIAAKCSLNQWIDRGGAAPGRYSQMSLLNAHLEQLMIAASSASRKQAFDQLTMYLPESADERLRPIELYTETCHKHHGGKDKTYGIWCLIFDPMERLAFRREQAKDEQMY